MSYSKLILGKCNLADEFNQFYFFKFEFIIHSTYSLFGQSTIHFGNNKDIKHNIVSILNLTILICFKTSGPIYWSAADWLETIDFVDYFFLFFRNNVRLVKILTLT